MTTLTLPNYITNVYHRRANEIMAVQVCKHLGISPDWSELAAELFDSVGFDEACEVVIALAEQS